MNKIQSNKFLRFDSKISKQMLKLYHGRGVDTLFFHHSWSTVPYELIASFVPEEGLIYDLGSGRGIFSNCMALQSPFRRVVGIDNNLPRIKCALATVKDKNNPVFYPGNIGEEEYDECEAFSLINVLHHCPSYRFQEKLIERCYEKLKPSGRLVIVDVNNRPRHKYVLCCFLEHLFHPLSGIYYRNEEKMLRLLEDVGFRVEVKPIDQNIPYALTLYLAEKISGSRELV